jgi:hypothetical protein
MLWQDLLFESPIEASTLARALAGAFGIETTAVRIVDEITPSLDSTGVRVLAERTPRRGQFPLQLSVYLRDPALPPRLASFPATMAVAQQLAGHVQSAVLITGDGDQADDDFLVRPTGEVFRVTLDDRLDDDEFVVVASEPFAPTAAPRSSS